MSIAVVTTANGEGAHNPHLQSPVRWRRRNSPSPVTAPVVVPQQKQLHHQLSQPQASRPRSLHAYRRSDPGLLGTMVIDVELNEEGGVIDSQWNVSRTGAMASCGVARSASLRSSFIRPKEPIWLLNVRQQLTEQLKCLDVRLESHVAMLGELQEFYKRRSEVELEYSRGMDKLVKQIMTRHKADKQRRESWPGYSTYTIWQTLLSTSRKLGRDHAVLADLYSTQMSTKIGELTDDVQRIYKKCHEMACSGHEELVKVLSELQSSMKTYQLYHNECLQAETKLRQAESQRVKVEQQQNVGGVTGAKNAISRRFRNYEKVSEKKQIKYLESRMKSMKARNEYILCLEAANAAIQKYFNDDLHELINTMDYGYHSTMGRVVLMHISADNNMLKSRQGCLDHINQRIRDLDQRADKQKFLEAFVQQFTSPPPFEFHSHRNDEVTQLCAQKFTQDELLDRLNAINERINSLRVESDEIWKTLETTDSALLETITRDDYDVTSYFQEEQSVPKSPMDKQRSDRLETEKFYLTKFQGYLTVNNLMARLQAKYDCIEKALEDSRCLESNRLPSVPPKPRRKKALGRDKLVGRPRLFGGTIEEYVEATGEEIPLVVKSCIRLINLYGMHHQGVFRVSGSQHEINDFKNQFESGKDAVPDKVDGKDINSVAGVLKLYFRELKDPLFPTRIFDELIKCSCRYNFNSPKPGEVAEGLAQLRTLLSALPKPVIIVMRYLFAFLNHVSEFSDENMMDPYNLAVCFGPTLLPVPADRDQVQFQPHVNEIVRTVIVHQEDLFPLIDPDPEKSTLYEKCLTTAADEDGGQEDSTDNLSDDGDLIGDMANEEDIFYEPEVKEAIALYGFQGRNPRELSFSKGDVLTLLEKLSNDWWEGTAEDREGLIPDKYIRLITRQEKANCRLDELKRKSVDSLPLSKGARRSARLQSGSGDEDATSAALSGVSSTSMDPDECSPVSYNSPASRHSSLDSGELLAVSSSGAKRKSLSATDASSCGSESGALVGDASPHKINDGVLARRRQAPERNETCDAGGTTGEVSVKVMHNSVDSLLTELERLTEKKDSSDKRCPEEQSVSLAVSSQLRGEPEASPSRGSYSRPPSGVEHNEDHSADSDYENVPGKSSTTSTTTRRVETVPADTRNPVEAVAKLSNETVGGTTDDILKEKWTTEDMSIDIDAALAEVMSGIELLRRDRCSSPKPSTKRASLNESTAHIRSPSLLLSAMRDFRHTPDLVVGLPYGLRPASVSASVSPKASDVTDGGGGSSEEVVSPSTVLTTAEVFANIDQCTIRKASGSSVSATASVANGTVSAPSSAGVLESNESPLKSATSSDRRLSGTVTTSLARDWTIVGGAGGVNSPMAERRSPSASRAVSSLSADVKCSSFRSPCSADSSPVRSALSRASTTTAVDRRVNVVDRYRHHASPTTTSWSIHAPVSERQTITAQRAGDEFTRTVVVVGSSSSSPKFDRTSNSVTLIVDEGLQSGGGGGSLPSRLSLATSDDGDKENSPSDGSVSAASDSDSTTVYASATLPRTSPEKKRFADSAAVFASAGSGAIKPPIKAKPQVIKKPIQLPSSAEAGEIWRKLNNLQSGATTSGGHVGGEVSARLQPK